MEATILESQENARKMNDDHESSSASSDARSQQKADFCGSCKEEVKDEDVSIQCDGACEIWFHKDCTGMTAGEFEILRRKTCKLLWVCESCKHEVLRKKNSSEILIDKMREMFMEMELKLHERLREEVTTSVQREMDELSQRPSVIKQGKRKDPQPTDGRELLSPNIEQQPPILDPPVIQNDEDIRRQENVRGNQPNETGDMTQVIETSEESHQPTWAEVSRRHRPKIVGTRRNQDNTLKAADRTGWLYVGKIHPSMRKEDVMNYLQDSGIQGNIECDQLDTKGYNKAFRIGVPFQCLESINHPEFWPEGVLVRQYIFRNPRNTGVILASAPRDFRSRELQ